MTKKKLLTISIFLIVFGMLATADALAVGYTITFNGRTFVDGVQTGGVTVKIWAKFRKEVDAKPYMFWETGQYTTVSDASGNYSLTIRQSNLQYEPYTAWMTGCKATTDSRDVCYQDRYVSMTNGSNRRHLYLTTYIHNDPEIEEKMEELSPYWDKEMGPLWGWYDIQYRVFGRLHRP